MNYDTYEVVKNLGDVPVDKLKDFFEVPDELASEAEEILDGQPSATVRADTEAGRKLIEFAKKAKLRKKNKAARKARRKSR
jgi:hypothetical protein